MTRFIVGNVSELWRYPVKSMGGELLAFCDLQQYGIKGDRCWAAKDEVEGEVTGAKRIAKLLMCKASYKNDPQNVDPENGNSGKGSTIIS